MDETVLKLPKYVFRRPNGSYRYKRNVPKVLQKYIYKKTLYRQLGATYTTAGGLRTNAVATRGQF